MVVRAQFQKGISSSSSVGQKGPQVSSKLRRGACRSSVATNLGVTRQELGMQQCQQAWVDLLFGKVATGAHYENGQGLLHLCRA